jgi:hypothetical protein
MLGTLAAAAVACVRSAFVYGIETIDAAAFAAAGPSLLAAGGLGALMPALRASRVDLARVLRKQ